MAISEETTTPRKRRNGRINLIDQANNQSEDSTEDDAENMIMQVGENGTPPFVLKGKINNVTFITMIESGPQ